MKKLKLVEALSPEEQAELLGEYELGWDDEIGLGAKEKTEKKKPLLNKKDMPTIIVTNRFLGDISDQAAKALAAANEKEPRIFNRGGALVKVAKVSEKNAHGEVITRPVVQAMNENMLRGELARSANYIKIVKETTMKPCSPPLDATKDILSRTDWPLPLLRGVTHVPIMRTDGRVVAAPGYDPVSSLYYAPGNDLLDFPGIPENPDNATVNAAVELLEGIICDFPFDSEASKANALAGIITPVLRDSINGHVPLQLVDKTKPGTGASLYADSISLIATGLPAYMTTQPTGREKENEWRKRITAILIDDRPVVVVDNLEGIFESPTLCALLTSTYWSDRLLGRNESAYLQHRICWMATGNNIRLGGDLPRRCYKIRLDARMARPWQRDTQKFKHPNLLEFVKNSRGRLLAAIYTLARTWILAGRPMPKRVPTMGSFEEWSRTIGGILEFAGVNGFLSNLNKMYDDAETGQGIEGFLGACYDVFWGKPLTAREIKRELKKNEELQDSLPDWLDYEDKGFTRQLGNLFASKEGAYFSNGVKLERDGTKNRAARWVITRDGYEDGYEDAPY